MTDVLRALEDTESEASEEVSGRQKTSSGAQAEASVFWRDERRETTIEMLTYATR